MLAALAGLKRLWYLILLCSIICLIADITFSSIVNRYFPDYSPIPIPFALIADISTVLIFAYGLWGKSRPFLLPSSSPTSNRFMRWARLVGTFLLCLLWILNTVIYISSEILVQRILAGIAILNSILILVEMVGSHRISKEQRRILKKERKEQQEKLEMKQLKLQKKEEQLLSQAGLGLEGSQTRASREQMNDLDNGIQSLVDSDNDDDNDEDGLKFVEIVRPEAIDSSTVIYNQQLMYEMHQRQYFLQYQQYLQNQNHLSPGGPGSTTGRQGLIEQDTETEGKYDDMLQESSYKFEIPIDGPLEGSSSLSAVVTASSFDKEKAGASSSFLSESSPPLMDVKSPFMNPPSAPSISGLTETMVTPPYNMNTTSSPPSPSSSLSYPTAALTSIPHSDERSSATSSQRQAPADSSPHWEQDYQSKSEKFASAPLYETKPSMDQHVPSVTMTLVSATTGSMPAENEVDGAVTSVKSQE